MNKSIAFVLSATFSILITGCGNDYKTGINETLAETPKCFLFLGGQYIDYSVGGTPDNVNSYKPEADYSNAKLTNYKNQLSVDRSNWSYYSKDKIIDSEKFYNQSKTELDALVSAGLLIDNGYDTVSGKDGFGDVLTYQIDLYNLTDKGKNSLYKKDGKTYLSFCYANAQVNRILNSYVTGNIAIVKYSTEFTNIADWVDNPKIQSAFPQIQKELNSNHNIINEITLFKTENGWQSTL